MPERADGKEKERRGQGLGEDHLGGDILLTTPLEDGE
jgi:hypothetical protein